MLQYIFKCFCWACILFWLDATLKPLKLIATEEKYLLNAVCPDIIVVEGLDGWYKSYEVAIDACSGNRSEKKYD